MIFSLQKIKLNINVQPTSAFYVCQYEQTYNKKIIIIDATQTSAKHVKVLLESSEGKYESSLGW